VNSSGSNAQGENFGFWLKTKRRPRSSTGVELAYLNQSPAQGLSTATSQRPSGWRRSTSAKRAVRSKAVPS